jgi:hypothetical protein
MLMAFKKEKANGTEWRARIKHIHRNLVFDKGDTTKH